MSGYLRLAYLLGNINSVDTDHHFAIPERELKFARFHNAEQLVFIAHINVGLHRSQRYGPIHRTGIEKARPQLLGKKPGRGTLAAGRRTINCNYQIRHLIFGEWLIGYQESA
jgi:hypothetical protein